MEDIPLGTLYTTLFILLLLSGFFSSSETGLMALNRYRLRHLANSGSRGARIAQHLLRKPDRLIGLILLGNNLVNILAASIATVIGIRLLGDGGIWAASLTMTVVVLIFAEVAPKTLAALHPERVAFPASYVLLVLLRIFYPIVWLVNGLANLISEQFLAGLLGRAASSNGQASTSDPPTLCFAPGRRSADVVLEEDGG